MKRIIKSLISVLCLTGIASAATACKVNPTTSSSTSLSTSSSSPTQSNTATTPVGPVEVDLMKGFVDGGDEVYTVVEAAGKTTISYEKAEYGWAAVKKDLTAYDLSEIKTLAFTIVGNGTVLMKIEGEGVAAEIKILAGTSTQYEWSLIGESNKAVLSTAKALILFCAFDSMHVKGEVEFTEFMFTSQEPGEGTAFLVNTGDDKIPQNMNFYNGSDATFDFNDNWEDKDSVYVTTKNNDGSVTVEFEKKVGTAWACMISNVSGDLSKFHYITFKLNGTAETKLLLKIEGSSAGATKEINFTLTGNDEDVVIIDISAYSNELKRAINKVVVFALPNSETGSGEFVIQEAYFTTEFEGDEKMNTYENFGNAFDVNVQWIDNGDSIYTFGKEDGAVKVVYNKPDDGKWEWSTMKTEFGGNISAFTQLSYKVKVEDGKQIMIKLGSAEKWITGTGEIIEEVWDISKIDNRNTLNNVLIFAEGGQHNVSGTFYIYSMQFTYARQVIDSTGVVAQNWYSNNKGAYSFEVVGNGTKVNFHEAKESWAYAAQTVKIADTYTKLVFSVTGTNGEEILFKAENTGLASESGMVTFDGTVQTFEIAVAGTPIATQTDLLVLFFAQPNNTGVTGSFIIHSVTFVK